MMDVETVKTLFSVGVGLWSFYIIYSAIEAHLSFKRSQRVLSEIQRELVERVTE